VWPPERYTKAKIRRVVFVAGGVGVNPLMSMFSSLVRGWGNEFLDKGFEVVFLYSTKKLGRAKEILFLRRLKEEFSSLQFQENSQSQTETRKRELDLRLFLPSARAGEGEEDELLKESKGFKVHRRRITEKDLLDALGKVGDRGGTVCYVCGVPEMTDSFVEVVSRAEGMERGRVLFEKWW